MHVCFAENVQCMQLAILYVFVYVWVCADVYVCVGGLFLSCLDWLSQRMDHYTLSRDLVSAPHLALLYAPKLFFL